MAVGGKPTVQVTLVAVATSELPLNVTPLGVVAAAIATGEPGLTAVTSWDVATLKLLARYEVAAGFVIPSMVTVPAVLLARLQVPARVIVTVWPVVEPVAVQLPPKEPLRVTAGFVGIPVNALLKTTVMVLPALSVPVLLVVKPTAQAAVAPALCGVPTKLTAVTDDGGVITMAEPGLAASVSELVLTLKPLAG